MPVLVPMGVNQGQLAILIASADSRPESEVVCTRKFAQAGGNSGQVLAWAFALLRDEPFDLQEHCLIYHEHWQRNGMTSLEAGGWK